MNTTNTTATLISYEAAANYISRLNADNVESFKKGVFSNSQLELEKLWRTLDKEGCSVEVFNKVLGFNISNELFIDNDKLRRYLKDNGMEDLEKIKSFIKNNNPYANEILDFMAGLVKGQASDIARIVEARQ